jgi:hypothetical protein
MQIGEKIIDLDSRKRLKPVYVNGKEIDFIKNIVGWPSE